METLDFANPLLNPGNYVAVKTLLTYPVSTCVAERSFSSMKRLKTPLRSAMSDVRLTSLPVIHVQKHKETDLNEVISEFAGKKDRRSIWGLGRAWRRSERVSPSSFSLVVF